MTDKEIVLKIVNNCFIDVSSLSYQERILLYNKLVTLTNCSKTMSNDILKDVYFLFSEYNVFNTNNIRISQLNNKTYKKFFEAKDKQRYWIDLIFLLPEDFKFLWDFYHNSENTTESLEKLIKQIDFNEQVLNKKKLLKQLHGLNIE